MNDAIEEQAAQWLARQDAHPLDAEGRAAFDAWLALSTRHRVTYLRLEAAWRSTDQLRDAPPARPAGAPPWTGERLRGKPIPDRRPPHRRLPGLSPLDPRPGRAWLAGRHWAGPAAVAAMALLALVPATHRWAINGIGAWSWPFAAGRQFSTGIGDRYTVKLRDGTQVELNTDTRLRTASADGGREVRLERGEAFFDVVHNEKHPFVVVSGNLRIVDVGTKFLVRRQGDKLTVTVAEGTVLVEDMAHPDTSPPMLVHQLNTVVAQPGGLQMVSRSREQVADALGWQHGVLVFADRPLREVAAEFNRYNHKRLVLPTDGPVGDIRIGGSFEATNVDAFARLLRTGFGLAVSDDGQEIKISSAQ